jgi:hypothetical protein
MLGYLWPSQESQLIHRTALEYARLEVDRASRVVNVLESRLHEILSAPDRHSVAKLQRTRDLFGDAVGDLAFWCGVFEDGCAILVRTEQMFCGDGI